MSNVSITISRPAHRFMATNPTSEITTITPQEADILITHYNTHNRRLNENTVKKYAHDMVNGRWKVTNQGVGIDRDGTVIDAQHRLHAIVKSGVPCRMTVVYGLDPESQKHIDGVLVRSHYQRLLLAGIKLTKLQYSIAYNLAKALTTKTYGAVAELEVEKMLDSRQDDLLYIASKVGSESTPKQLKRVNFLTAIAEYLEKSPVKARKFFEEVVHPTGAGIGEPAATLRNYLLTTTGRHSAEQGVNDYYKTIAVINRYHKGEEMPKSLHRANGWEI